MNRAVIYEFHKADPTADRIIRRTTTGELAIVLIGDPSEIPAVAARLTEEGVGLIELCGGIPLASRAQLKDTVGTKAHVASVTFGIESIVKAAEFNHAFMAGTPLLKHVSCSRRAPVRRATGSSENPDRRS